MLDVIDVYQNIYYYPSYREYYSMINEAKLEAGVIIADVEAKSSASLAGLQKNDIITKVDGNDIASSAYLRYYLYKHKVGDEMKLTIIRNNKEMDLKVKLVSK